MGVCHGPKRTSRPKQWSEEVGGGSTANKKRCRSYLHCFLASQGVALAATGCDFLPCADVQRHFDGIATSGMLACAPQVRTMAVLSELCTGQMRGCRLSNLGYLSRDKYTQLETQKDPLAISMGHLCAPYSVWGGGICDGSQSQAGGQKAPVLEPPSEGGPNMSTHQWPLTSAPVMVIHQRENHWRAHQAFAQ